MSYPREQPNHNDGCIGFRNGCTCGPCQVVYFTTYANSCTYGTRQRANVFAFGPGIVKGHG